MEKDNINLKTDLNHLKSIVNNIQRTTLEINPELSFEFIIMSLFPNAYDKLKDLLMQKYIEGYNAGVKAKNEN